MPSDVECSFLPGTESLPVLDVSSSINDQGTLLTIAVLNRSVTDQIDLQVKVAGANIRASWTAHELNASSIEDANTLGHPEKNVVTYHTTTLPEVTKHFVVAAHSITLLQVGLEPRTGSP